MSAPDAKPAILVIEDDRSIREGLALNLRLKGYLVETASDGEEGLSKAFGGRWDLILLDIMLPGCSGLEILQELRDRENPVPVLVLSARGSTPQKVEGLGLGADDYLAKPFELSELLARVKALLRRAGSTQSSQVPLQFGNVTVDVAGRKVCLLGQEVRLTAKEFDLLLLLARSPGRTFSRETILERVWGYDFEGTQRTVDNHVVSLRKLLEEDPSKPRHLITVRQIGYRLET